MSASCVKLGAPRRCVWPVERQQLTARRSRTGKGWPQGTEGQPVHLRIVAAGWPRPTCGAGVVRSSPWRKSPRTRRPAPRAMLGAVPVYLCRGNENFLLYTQGSLKMFFTPALKTFSKTFSWTQGRAGWRCSRPSRSHPQQRRSPFEIAPRDSGRRSAVPGLRADG